MVDFVALGLDGWFVAVGHHGPFGLDEFGEGVPEGGGFRVVEGDFGEGEGVTIEV